MIKKFLLLKSLGVNFPVLQDWGYSFPRLVTVVVPQGEVQKATNIFKSYSFTMLDEFSKKEDIRKALVYTHSAFVVFPYKKSTRSDMVIDQLYALIQAGFVDGIPIQAIPILITDDFFVEDQAKKQFVVYADNGVYEHEISIDSIVPSAEQLPLVKDNIDMVTKESNSEEERVLLAACCFMYPVLKQRGEEKKLIKLFQEVRYLCAMEEEVRDLQGMDTLFLDVLNTWQEEILFHDVYELPFIDDAVMANKDEVIFYDEEYIFLSDKLFKMIVKPILHIVPLSRLKLSLKEEGILTTHKDTGTFTVKMPYVDDRCNKKRITMLRFLRRKLNRAGKLDIITTCRLRKNTEV